MHLSEGYPPDFEQTSACLSVNLVYILPVSKTDDELVCPFGSRLMSWSKQPAQLAQFESQHFKKCSQRLIHQAYTYSSEVPNHLPSILC